MEKLYIVVRADIPHGARVAQSVHAAFQIGHEHPELVASWLRNSSNLVVLEIPDETALMALRRRAELANVPVSLFREPDFGGTATALALGPEAWRMVSSLPLALRAA
jgi:peptidyl-tRNA hydrolase